jgi:fibro-slime domain-containing protein
MKRAAVRPGIAFSFLAVIMSAGSIDAEWFSQNRWSNDLSNPADSIATVNSYKVKVTYYDFHQDKSNPDFLTIGTRVNPTKNIEFGVIKGMVMDTLDADKKPIPSADPLVHKKTGSRCIERWFRPWVPGDTVEILMPLDTTISVYKDSTAEPETTTTFFGVTIDFPLVTDTTILPPDTMRGDTLFKNIQIDDSLEFIELPYTVPVFVGFDSAQRVILDTLSFTGMYWVNSPPDSFFPLNNRGLPYEYDTAAIKRNFGFTMELHNSFEYKGGEVMNIITDDCGWVFVNNRMAIDNGGYHGPFDSPLTYLDSIADTLGIVKGNVYNLDIFFAENGGARSTCLFASNLNLLEKSSGSRQIALKTTDLEGAIREKTLSPTNFRMMWVAVGAARVCLAVPSTATLIRFSLADASGKILWHCPELPASRVAYAVRNIDVPPGAYFLRALCEDSKGNRAVTLARPLLNLR